MSAHEFTLADCTWADLHFSDLGEAREHLDSLIEAKKTLQSMKRLKTFAESPECIASDSEIARIDLGIAELESRESELVALINKCGMNELFD
tara:strand:+ start:14766 stop:15041 length:276 start_codon:yes stop_codon:yes gene_type:complete